MNGDMATGTGRPTSRGWPRITPLSLAMVGFLALATPAAAVEDGLVTRPSTHGVRDTLDRFSAGVRAAGWVLFSELDHTAAAREVGITLPTRMVVLLGNPRAGTPAMAAHPTLAIDLPMRVLVWQDEQGRVFITRSTGADIAQRVFARHGITIPASGQSETEAFLDGLARKATE